MSEELLNKMNNNNYKIVDELIAIIEENNIGSIDELKKYQDGLFVINNQTMNHDEEINYCSSVINSTVGISEDKDFVDVQNIMKLKRKITNCNFEEKIISLIRLFSLLDKEIMLPYDAYILIMNDKL